MNAADRYRWDSQWPEAAAEYQRALGEFPDDAAARSGLGFCYMQTKQWQQALNEYEHILKRDPSNVIALSKTAELYVILNRRGDAYKAYLHLAELYSQAGQGARAEAAWQRAVQLSPGNPEPHERLAAYYNGKKDISMMIQERLAAAQGYLARNDSAAAEAQCEAILRVDATNTQAQQLLARVRGQKQTSGSLAQGADAALPSTAAPQSRASGPLAAAGSSATEIVTMSNTSGGNTGIMGNMGSAGNFNGGANPGPAMTAGAGMGPGPRKRITASQVTGVLQQAQTFQTQGRFNDAIDLCEQILESGFDRPDARYFLGWLYQEQRRWDEAIRQFQTLLNDPDYALSCYYALGQCYRARGDLRTATMHFDEAVDRVNLDVLTEEESEQLVQLCQEAAEAHRQLGEMEQAFTVYNALLGFLRSRGWNEKVVQVEFMLKQLQNMPAPPPPAQARPQTSTPFPQAVSNMQSPMQPVPPVYPETPPQGNRAPMMPAEQMPTMQQPFVPQAPNQNVPDAATMAFNANGMQPVPPAPPAGNQANGMPPTVSMPPAAAGTLGELPDWLTGILNDADKTVPANKQPAPPAPPSAPAVSAAPATQALPTNAGAQPAAGEVTKRAEEPAAEDSTSWLTDGAKPANTTRTLPQDQPAAAVPAAQDVFVAPPPLESVPAAPSTAPAAQPAQVMQPAAPQPEPVASGASAANAPVVDKPMSPAAPPEVPPAPEVPGIPITPKLEPVIEQASPVLQVPGAKSSKSTAEDLLSQIAGTAGKDEAWQQVAESVLASTANLPEKTRLQVVQSMQDIRRYIDHGLLIPAAEECLRVIDMAPQYLDIHQVLCEIYVRQGKIEQAITKYAILIDTYIVSGRIDDAIATYRRILQLEPDNLTYRMRLISLLASQGNKEDLLRERTLAAESYLRLGYMDRALTELEQALQENPTNVSTRLNYALALQKLGRSQQAVAEYQRVLQIDPRNITALVRWHIAMITGIGTPRATTLEVLSRIRWQLRGEGLKNYDMVVREYNAAAEIYPNNADVRFALGQVHQQSGNFDRAIDAYQLAMRDSSFEVMARASSAQCLLAQGKLEATIQQLEQALQVVRTGAKGSIDPTVWAARPREEGEEHQAPEVEISLALAKAYGRAGKQEKMEAILRRVRQKTSYQDEVASTLAEISARQGDLNAALQEYAELARQYRGKRQVDNALTVLKEMAQLAPQDPRAHAELADIYINRGLLDEGIAELRLLADIYLRNDQFEEAGEALWRIGNINSEIGNTEEAFMNLRRAVELKPDDMGLLREVVGYACQIGRPKEAAQYQEVIARHYFETQQVKEAVAALQQLIALDRHNYEAYDMLGQTYQSVGEYEQASRVYKNLAKVNPGSAIARERLASLQELRAKSV
jgi:tetratricopeptide (TPR) repeat protein